MRDFFYGREDDDIYQYCPEGENNVLITSNGSDVFIASQNPDGNTAIEDQMSYKCAAYCTGGSGDSSESGNLAPIISNSSLPQPLRTDVYDFEDPNRTCTWNMYYTPFSYETVEQSYFDISDAMQKCVELGKNQCNGVRRHSYWRCPHTYRPIFISGLSDEVFVENINVPTMPGYYTWVIGDCSMWRKWPNYYLSGQSYNDETHYSLAAAQESCHMHGPLCNAVKRNKEKYYLMRNQDIPSKETGTWADYWVKLAAYN